MTSTETLDREFIQDVCGYKTVGVVFGKYELRDTSDGSVSEREYTVVIPADGDVNIPEFVRGMLSDTLADCFEIVSVSRAYRVTTAFLSTVQHDS